MKKWKGLQRLFCISCIVALMTGQTVLAKEGGNEKNYTYTVTVYTGNQGTFSDTSGVQVDNHTTDSGYQIIKPEQENDKICITGLEYGDRIIVTAPSGVELKEADRYYVKGIRESGRDNNTVGASAFLVDADREYVVAYGIRGDMTAYVINYQDTEGNILAESQTFYGTVGDHPVVAFRYVEGYRPQAYNLTRTLSRNEAENVFTFVYEAVSEQSVQNQGGIQAGGNQNAAGNPNGANGNQNAADADGNNGVLNDNVQNADAGELVNAQEEQTPKELVNLDDEETPLAEIDAAGAGAKSTKDIPVWIGVAAAVLAGVGFLFIRRQKKGKRKGKKKGEGETEKEEK